MARLTGLEPVLFQLCAISLGKSAITAASYAIAPQEHFLSRTIFLCKICNNETKNPSFCSRRCSASRPKPKKLIKIHCKHCKEELPRKSWKDRRRTCCDACNPLKKDWSKISYSSMLGERSYQKHSRIRELARQAYERAGLPKKCHICNYDKHYEIHHIKPINQFSPDDTISKINDLLNLVALCPNHHWEVDNNLILTGREGGSRTLI
jgi:hypothetical protein